MTKKKEEKGMNKWVMMLLGMAIGFLIGWFLFGYLAQDNDAYATDQVEKKAYCHKNSGARSWTYKFNKAWVQHFRNNGTPRAGHEKDFYTWKGNVECLKVRPTPTNTPVPPTPTPTKRPPPPVCEIEKWSCSECQTRPPQGLCWKDFQSYCGESYGCDWVETICLKEDCPTEWTCKDTCEPNPTTRLCHWDKDGYEAIAVTEGERIRHEKFHELDVDWVEGMDAVCKFPPPPLTPTPEPTQPPQEDKPSGCTENCNPPAPQCSADAVVNEPANFHVYRKGDTAILKWNATGGNKVNAYWKHPDSGSWEHATQSDNTGYLEIHGLGSDDWTFGLEQVNDCGGGVITTGRMMEVVDGNTHGWVLFR